jgi:hypothetical protein
MITSINEFKKHMNENHNIAVMDMDVEAKKIVDEVNDAFQYASTKLYDLKKMADDVRMEFPGISETITSIVEPIMITLENDYPEELQNILRKFRK